jgi:hypothetical protein
MLQLVFGAVAEATSLVLKISVKIIVKTQIRLRKWRDISEE